MIIRLRHGHTEAQRRHIGDSRRFDDDEFPQTDPVQQDRGMMRHDVVKRLVNKPHAGKGVPFRHYEHRPHARLLEAGGQKRGGIHTGAQFPVQ